jgi:uncharacterized protein (DUF433 family)
MENATNEQVNGRPTVIRTERGLSVAGTRITLYALMDFIKEAYPHKYIRAKFNLTEQQMTDVLAYIEAHQAEVEAEYQQVVQQAEELRRYHEAKLPEHLAMHPAMPDTPEKAAIRARLAARKAQYQNS